MRLVGMESDDRIEKVSVVTRAVDDSQNFDATGFRAIDDHIIPIRWRHWICTNSGKHRIVRFENGSDLWPICKQGEGFFRNFKELQRWRLLVLEYQPEKPCEF